MKKMAKAPFRIENKFFVLLVLSVLFLSTNNTFGYVMPSEQILGFMVKNFEGFRTVTLIQSTLQTADSREKVFTEQLWLEAPNKYATKALDRIAERNIIAPDILYRQLFTGNSLENIERILLTIGVDLSKTSYTRFEGAIAYRIGDKGPDSPKLIIEKKRFLPLMLIYRIPDKPDRDLITVKFEDYQKQDKGWYPFEITYEQGDNYVEKYTVQTFQANVTIDVPLNRFPEYELPEVPEEAEEPSSIDPSADSKDEFVGDTDNTDIDKERLRNVIKAFEEEYQ